MKKAESEEGSKFSRDRRDDYAKNKIKSKISGAMKESPFIPESIK